jgi:hypothetical protein
MRTPRSSFPRLHLDNFCPRIAQRSLTLLFVSASKNVKHLGKKEANALATEFMEALQQVLPSGQPVTLEDVAKGIRSGLRYFDNSVPVPTNDSPPFLRSLLSPLMTPQTGLAPKDESSKEFKRLLSNPPGTAKGMHDLLARIWLNASPTDVLSIRKQIEQAKSLGANSLEVRNQLVDALRKNMKGKPGPKRTVPRQEWARICESSGNLRPVCQKVLEFSQKESTQPLAKIIGAVASLRPEWETQCNFLSSRTDLIIRALKLSKIRKAKVRGQSSKLADALACEFSGYSAAPSYSMQIVEQARRSQRK